MANPIKYTDLFDPGVQSGVEGLKGALEATRTELERMMGSAKAKGSELARMLSSANPSTEEGRNQIKMLSQTIQELTDKYRVLKEAADQCNRSINSVDAIRNEALARREAARAAEAEAKAAAALAKQKEAEAKATKASVELSAKTRQAQIQESQAMENLAAALARKNAARAREKKALESVAASSATYIGLQKDEITQDSILQASYNQLAATYKMLKKEINELTGEQRAAGTEGAKMIDNARLIYEQMNRLQQETGRYQLQVGNYEKAFNGLDIAMQQIVRETPTITMGARMYFMAISNNLPILTDQIKRIREENAARQAKIDTMKAEGAATAEIQALQKQQISVGKQLLSSLFSWQTAMIAAITLLTMYGDEIIDWISNAFAAEGATKAWKEAQEDLNKTFDEAEVSAAKAEAQADTIYKIATDETRSVEDRIKAGQILQNQYEDYFGNLSTEEIMLGKAVKAHDDLTKSLMNQAKARAYLDKITELYGKRIEAQAKVDEAQKTLNEKQGASREFQNQVLSRYEDEELNNAGYNMGARVNAEIDRAKAHVGETVQGVKAIDDEIKKLRDEIPVDGLFDELFNGGGRKGKGPKVVDPIDAVISNLKYIRQAREAEINNIEDDTERELALTEFKYDNEIADLRAFAAQQQAIAYTVAELEQELEKETNLEKRNAMQERINDLKREWNITEEGVQAVNDTIIQKEIEKDDKLAEIRQKRIDQLVSQRQNQLKLELDLANKRAENDLEGDALDEQKIQNQIQYWTAMLASMEAFNDGSEESELRIKIVRETLRGLLQDLNKEEKSGNIFEKLFGKDYNKFLRGLERVLKMTANNIKEIISLYEEMAEAAVKAAEAQVSAAERVYEAELNAYENGYANNVEFARKELELRRNQLAEAQAEQEKYARMQEQVDSLTQISSMITAAANLFKSTSGAGPIGVAVAVAAIAAMFASFAAAKIQARQLAGASKQYGEGGTEYIDYGNSHASGHDVDFGTMPDGRPRRIERGETVAVINAKQTSKYGYSTVSDIIDSINKGEFVERYMTAFSGADGEFTMNMSSSFDSPYLSDISRDLKAIRKGGEYSESVMADGSRIVRYKNYTRRIRP